MHVVVAVVFIQWSCYTEHGKYGLSFLYVYKLWSIAVLGLYDMSEFKLCCKILLLLNMAN